MTLQIALLGKDGVLIASDTLVTTSDFSGEETRIYEYEDKVILNSDQTVAVAWSENKPSKEFIIQLTEAFDKKWGQESSLLHKSCRDLWEIEKQKDQCIPIDCNFIVAKSRMRQVYKAAFSRERNVDITPHREGNMIWAGLSAGQKTNSACFFTQAYKQDRIIPVERLIRWAAYYILMGAKVSSGIEGLTIHVSKDGGVFQRLSDDKIHQLEHESKLLYQHISKFLFSPFSLSETKRQPGGLA